MFDTANCGTCRLMHGVAARMFELVWRQQLKEIAGYVANTCCISLARRSVFELPPAPSPSTMLQYNADDRSSERYWHTRHIVSKNQ